MLTASPLTYDARYGDVWANAGSIIRQEWVETPTVLEVRLREWTEANELPYFDTTPLFREWMRNQPEPAPQTFYPLDGHWTSDGHILVGKWLVVWIEESGLLDD